MAAEGDSALPTFQSELMIDDSKKETLNLFAERPISNTVVEAYEAERRQRIAAGESLGAYLESRVVSVRFGRYGPSNAAVVICRVDFKPKRYNGVLRFRDAQVEIQVYRGSSSEDCEASTADSKGPQIVRWYPELAQGPAKSTFESFGFEVDGNVPIAGGASVGPKASYSVSRERLKRRVIHGSLLGDTGRIVNWKVEENASAGDGIPPVCDFGILTRWPQHESFHLRMKVRATTVAGIPVVGKDIRGISFTPSDGLEMTDLREAFDVHYTPAVTGGALIVGAATYADERLAGTCRSPLDVSVEPSIDLTNTSLESCVNVAEQLLRA